MISQYLTVTQLNEYINNLLASDELLPNLWLKGEITGFRSYRQSGHFYFTLKDKDSLINCVMFKSRARRIDFTPEDGMEVLARGNISVYSRQGKYQLYIEEMQPSGRGGLFLYLEKLKSRLEAEGYFARESKKPLPAIVNTVGIVTSQDGAALKDILRVIKQRHSRCRVILVHSSVQGDDAPRELAEGLRLLNEHGEAEVIIIGRGGGSLEDLMPFNSEEVVKAIYHSAIPVISAVGHEIDFSLADFAADMRAATPTGGAALAVPDMELLESDILRLQQRIIKAMARKMAGYSETLDRLMMKRIWKQPEMLGVQQKEHLVQLNKRILTAIKGVIKDREQRLSILAASLDGLSPLKAMQRGYALVRQGDKIIRSGVEIEIGEQLEVALQDANIDVEIINKEVVERWKT